MAYSLFRKISDRLKNEKPIFLFLAVIILVVIFAAPVANRLTTALIRNSLETTAEEIEGRIGEELSYTAQATKEAIEAGEFERYIDENDALGAAQALSKEAARTGLTTMVAVNKEGIVLSRFPITGRRNDYVFLTTPWGRKAADGEEVSTAGTGRVNPLVLISAIPILEDKNVAGAVFGGFILDNAYAFNFKKKYLAPDMHIAFYSKEDGLFSNTFTANELQSLLGTYFNSGSEWVQNGKSELGENVLEIEGVPYHVANIALPGIDESPGGVLLFIPRKEYYPAIAFAGAALLIFLLTVFHAHKVHRKDKLVLATTLAGCVVILALGYLLYRIVPDKRVVAFKEPPYTIYNSTLELEPDSDILHKEAEHRIAIRLISGGEAINVIKVVLRYDSNIAAVQEISTTNSICSKEFVIERTIDPKAGLISFTCGIPSPGFTGQRGTVAELVVQPLQSGEMTISFDPGQSLVLANDGLGTNVLRAATNGSYRIISLAEMGAKAPAQVSPFSSTHPNATRWYRRKDVRIDWPNLGGEYEYAYALNQSPLTNPDGAPNTKRTNALFRLEKDGVYYFHVRALRGGVPGPVSHLKINIDATPPPHPVIRISTATAKPHELVRFEFSGTDGESGLQENYYIKFHGGVFFPILPKLYIPFVEEGRHSITLRVFDNAGNWSDTNTEIVIKK